MPIHPIQLGLTREGELIIDWEDGQRRRYSVGELRTHCPCAGCQGHGVGTPAAPPPVEPGLTIRQMDPVGNYAYRILFSDGHETGIYTLELLRRLGVAERSSPGMAE